MKDCCKPYLHYLCQCLSLHWQAGEGWDFYHLGNGGTRYPLCLWVGHFCWVHTGRGQVERAYWGPYVILSESDDKTLPVDRWPNAEVFQCKDQECACNAVDLNCKCHEEMFDGKVVGCCELVMQEQLHTNKERRKGGHRGCLWQHQPREYIYISWWWVWETSILALEVENPSNELNAASLILPVTDSWPVMLRSNGLKRQLVQYVVFGKNKLKCEC